MPIINEACFSYTVILVVAPWAVTSVRNIATRAPITFELSNLQATKNKYKENQFLKYTFFYQISINTSIWLWSKRTASMLQYRYNR